MSGSKNPDKNFLKPEIREGAKNLENNGSEEGAGITGKKIKRLHRYVEEEKDFIDDNRKEENINFLINDFDKEKSIKKKLAILERISESGIINDEILSLVERFSNNLIAENKKIWEEDEEYASFFEDESDNDDSIIRPFVLRFTEILEKTKRTEYQSRGEKIAIDLLKNWNDFEIDYFYNFLGELNNWDDKEQAKESIVEAEYNTMHLNFGIDENIDAFDENIKRAENLNTDFLHNKNRLINLIGEVGSKKSVDFILEEILKNKRSAHNNEVATAFLKMDPDYAKQKLIELAVDNDEIVRVNSIMTLYRLQFGELNKDGNLEISNKDDMVCHKFHEIIEQIELSREKLENLFKNKKEISDEEIDKIVQNLISKAGQMLIDFSEKVNVSDETDKKDLITQELENYKTDLILTASVYKGMDKENMNFEDLEGVEFEKKNANDLSDEEISQMKNIYARNYKDNPEFQKAILDNFDNILKKSGDNTEVYFYKDKGKVVVFNRFDVMSEGRKYFGSFNVDPTLNSSSIGSSLIKVSMEKESKNNEIEADCIPKTLISSKYIGRNCGFIVKKINSNYKETGVALFNIEKKEDNKKYHYFNYSDKEIIEEYNSKNSDNQYEAGSDKFILKFELKSKELVNMTEELISENYIMSNYFFSKNGKEAYCAFEKI